MSLSPRLTDVYTHRYKCVEARALHVRRRAVTPRQHVPAPRSAIVSLLLAKNKSSREWFCFSCSISDTFFISLERLVLILALCHQADWKTKRLHFVVCYIFRCGANGESARRSVFANLMLLINSSRPAHTPVFFMLESVWGRQAARSDCSVTTSAFWPLSHEKLTGLIRRVYSNAFIWTDCLLTFRFIFFIPLITFSPLFFFCFICFL